MSLKQTEAAKEESEDTKGNTTTFQWIQISPASANEEPDSLNLSDVIFLLLKGLMPSREEEVQHNLHIANNGYTYENNLAYFPLYPLMVKGLASTLNWFAKDCIYVDGIGEQANPSTIILSSIFTNTIFFVIATDRLYLLSRIVLKDEYLAYKSALFFCISPASVLFVAPLTLTLLSAASFAAMVSVEKGMGLFTGKARNTYYS